MASHSHKPPPLVLLPRAIGLLDLPLEILERISNHAYQNEVDAALGRRVCKNFLPSPLGQRITLKQLLYRGIHLQSLSIVHYALQKRTFACSRSKKKAIDDAIKILTQKAFLESCHFAQLSICQYLKPKKLDVSSKVLSAAFGNACGSGQLEVAQWINNVVRVGRCDTIVLPALIRASKGGFLNIVKWLCSFVSYSTLDISLALKSAYLKFQYTVCHWLTVTYPMGELDRIHMRQATLSQACLDGNLLVAKQMYRLLNRAVPDQLWRNHFFLKCCETGRLKIAQWLKSIGPLSVDLAQIELAFELCIINNHLEMAKWMYDTWRLAPSTSVIVRVEMMNHMPGLLGATSNYEKMAAWLATSC